MKKKIFSKDECAPDAQTIYEFCLERFGLEFAPLITALPMSFRHRSRYGDDTYIFIHDENYYMAQFSCGVYEDLYLIDLAVAIELINSCLESDR